MTSWSQELHAAIAALKATASKAQEAVNKATTAMTTILNEAQGQIEKLQKELQEVEKQQSLALLAAQHAAQQAAQHNLLPARSTELQAFYTATQPLNIWLNHRNFKYAVNSYQREYEWNSLQVKALLESIERVCNQVHKNNKQPGAVLKVAEIVLLQRQPPQKANFTKELNGHNWYLDHGRYVEIVDGQQRITTLLLTYAALQHQLFQQQKQQKELGLDSTLDKRCDYEINNIADRLRYETTKQLNGLPYSVVLERAFDAEGNQRFKFSRCDFDPDPKSGPDRLSNLLADHNLQHNMGTKEEANAIFINRWLKEHAEAAAQQRSLSKKSLEGRSAALEWLLRFKDTLDTRVLFTTTLTPYEDLALRTFVSYNVQSTKVALTPLGIIKVALVSDPADPKAHDERGCKLQQRSTVPRSIETWKCTLEMMGRVCADLGGGNLLAWLRPLSTLSASASSNKTTQGQLLMLTKNTLMEELLRLRLAVHRAKVDRSCSLVADGDALVRKFSALRHEMQQWDPYGFMTELAAYGRALASLLTQQWCRDNFTCRASMCPEAGHILRSLLSVPKGVERLNLQQQDEAPDVPDNTGDLDAWRPLVLLLLWATEPGRLVSSNVKANELLLQGLRQIECVTLCAMLREKRPKSMCPQLFGAMTAELLSNSTSMSGLEQMTTHGGLVKVAVSAKMDPSKLHPDGCVCLDGGIEKLVDELYAKDLYRPNNSLRARSVLLLLEGIEPGGAPDIKSGGNQRIWTGTISVEHILPQKLDGAWTQSFEPDAHKALLNKLGNLGLLSGPYNSEASNRNFDTKRKTYKKSSCKLLEVVAESKVWTPHALVERHHKLIKKLAERYGISVTEGEWQRWQKNLKVKAGLHDLKTDNGSSGSGSSVDMSAGTCDDDTSNDDDTSCDGSNDTGKAEDLDILEENDTLYAAAEEAARQAAIAEARHKLAIKVNRQIRSPSEQEQLCKAVKDLIQDLVNKYFSHVEGASARAQQLQVMTKVTQRDLRYSFLLGESNPVSSREDAVKLAVGEEEYKRVRQNNPDALKPLRRKAYRLVQQCHLDAGGSSRVQAMRSTSNDKEAAEDMDVQAEDGRQQSSPADMSLQAQGQSSAGGSEDLPMELSGRTLGDTADNPKRKQDTKPFSQDKKPRQADDRQQGQ